jgi:TetR/AcrR family transcriptional regulator, transcriptional repressor of bet genes
MNDHSFNIWQNTASRPPDYADFAQNGVQTSSMTAAVKKRQPAPGRTASREARRLQLIDATMKCIVRKGISGTTLAEVAKVAGLSQGIVNLHFRSKDNLLNETLRFLADEYQSQFEKALAKAGPGPAEKLLALMELDLRPSLCNPQKLAVWFAFWGEVKSRPTYRRICDAVDQHYDEVILGLCQAIIAEGGYRHVTAFVAMSALTSMTNGLWLSCLVSPQLWNRHEAMQAVMSYLCSVFPQHFDGPAPA